MNMPVSILNILDIMHPGAQYGIVELERAQRVIKLIAAAKSIAIDQLEVTIKEVRDQNTALQVHNTELLLRARDAEGLRDQYLDLLDDVSASLNNTVGQFGPQMTPADRINRSALASRARAICDKTLRQE